MTHRALEHDALPILRSKVRLAPFTSLKVGGDSEYFAEARSAAEVLALLRWADDRNLECRFIGGGSNLLIADDGFRGVAARYTADELRLPSENEPFVVVEAGYPFPKLARHLARLGWGGLEWASNVPGTVGGAVVNNAGAFGSCVANELIWAEVGHLDGSVERLPPSDLEYSYRGSRLKRRELGSVIVLRAALSVARTNPALAVAQVKSLEQQRTATQPRQLSAGSVFANPEGDYAGRLIEAAGLKGSRIGDAQISEQHANFIVNLGKATATEVYQLVQLAQVTVWTHHAVWLRPEIELLGEWSAGERDSLQVPPAQGDEP